MHFRESLVACLCTALGAGAAVGVAACGDDERGGVEVEGARTGAGAGKVGTTGADTVGTTGTGTGATTGTGTAKGATAPEAPDGSRTETAK